MKKKPNILFILVDTLRAKNLGCYGYSKPTSPHIDKLADDGILFENAFSSANTTDPSLTSIFSGKYPISHGITEHAERVRREDIQRFYDSGTLLLPEILKGLCYQTLAVDWLGRWHRRGYDYYSGVLDAHKLKPHTHLLNSMISRLPTMQQAVLHSLVKPLISVNERKIIDNAKTVTDKAIDLIERFRREEFFLFVHYWDVHAPYTSPTHTTEQFVNYDYGNGQSVDEVLNQFDPKHRAFASPRIPKGVTHINEVLARYDASIAFVDEQVGRLLIALEKNDVSDETFVILTSDHGESLVEHGIFFDHHGLYDATIRVPLIFRYPSIPTKKRFRGMVQHVDLVPTILDVLGIYVDILNFDGKSMLPLLEKGEQIRSAVYVEEYTLERKRAIRTADYKCILALSEKDALCRGCGYVHGGTKELYELDKDHEETHNVVEENPEMAGKLEEKLSKWTKFLEFKKGKRLTGQAKTYDPFEDEKIVQERLKALGYF